MTDGMLWIVTSLLCEEETVLEVVLDVEVRGDID